MSLESTSALSRDAVGASGAFREFSLRFSERKLLLASFDLLVLNLAFYISLNLREAVTSHVHPLSWFLVLSLIWFGCAAVAGGYDLVRAANLARSLGCTFAALGVTWAIYLLLPYVTPSLPDSRFGLATFPALALVGLTLWRLIYATVFAHPNFQQRALIVGAGIAGQTLAEAVSELGQRGRKEGKDVTCFGYRVLGFVDDGVARGAQFSDVPVLGNRADLPRLIGQLKVNELVLAITHLETIHHELFETIQQCREWGVSITTMADLYERLTGRVPIEHAGRSLGVVMPMAQRPTHRFYLMFQRVCDILGALVGCVFLGLVIPFVWLANWLKSPGPLFYSQERVGKGGRPFKILKFRSMRTDAEKFGAVWAEENDPRITPVGNLLRKTRLDEIPQFWNILCGDMSLIGPRPERPVFVEQLTREIPFYRVRHAVKPGLSGWAQVKYRYGASVEDSLIKLQYDLFYIKRQNLWLDAEIVFKTIPIILGFKGR